MTTLAGDHPGRVRIVVTDSSGHDQKEVFWGFRSKHYDSANTAKLFYEAEALTPLVPVTTLQTRTGASGGGTNNVYRLVGTGGDWFGALFTDLSGVGPLTHVGTYRVLVRVAAPPDGSAELAMRFVWGVGDLAHAVTNGQVTVPADDNFYIVDLGVIRLDKPPVGDYQWRGIVEAKETGGITVDFDCLWLQPLDESAGVASATDGIAIVAGGPPVADEAIYADKTMEARTDGVFREDSIGGPYNPVGIVTGDLPRIPPSGLENRPVELLVKPTRGSIVQASNASPDPDASATDTFTVTVKYRPSYMFRP